VGLMLHLSMNLVAADVRRLILIASGEVRASLRRLLRVKVSMRDFKIVKATLHPASDHASGLAAPEDGRTPAQGRKRELRQS